MAKSVLISGASIAGPALAFWLAKYGFETTIVERAPSLRLGGQNIDCQSEARKIVRWMGLEDAIRQVHTGEKGVAFVDARNRVQAEFPSGTSDTATFSQELEFLRGDLVQILYDQTHGSTEYLFGDTITGLEDRADKIVVQFAGGAIRSFDLVVAADGIRSRTRELIIGDTAKIKSTGLYMTYVTIPRGATDDGWSRWYNALGARVVFIRPDQKGTARASLSFLSPSVGYERLPVAEQRRVLIERFQGAGWETDRVLSALETTDDFYLDEISQVVAPRWSRGRAALVGDAAYCPTPLTGMGASLALIGAYVLAGELATHQDHREAFDAYDRRLRPFVQRIQKLPPGVPWAAHPKSRAGVWLLNRALWVGSTRLFNRPSGGGATSSPDRFDLVQYAS